MKSAKLVGKSIPPPLPSYMENWVREYGSARVLQALEEVYYARVCRVVKAHTDDMSLAEFQRDTTRLKDWINGQKP